MTEEGCSHFVLYLREFSRDTFSIVNAYFGAPISKSARRRKVYLRNRYESGDNYPRVLAGALVYVL